MKKLYCCALIMMCISPLFAQKIEMKSGSNEEIFTDVLFKDSLDCIIGKINIAQKNPFNQLPAKVIAIDELGNKTYIASKEDILYIFPKQLRSKYEQVLDYNSINVARLYSKAQVFRTTNKYLVLAYILVADDPEQHELLAEKCMIYVYDGSMNEIFNYEVIPSINNYASVTKNGKYLAIQNGTVDEHLTLFPEGIQVVDIKTNTVVYNLEAIIYGPVYDENCEMVKFIMILPNGYRYLFLNDIIEGLIYIDISNPNERLIEITKDGLIFINDSQHSQLVKFKEMQIINLK